MREKGGEPSPEQFWRKHKIVGAIETREEVMGVGEGRAQVETPINKLRRLDIFSDDI